MTPNKVSTARFAAYLVSRFEIYFTIKLQSSAFAPRFQNPFEAAKRRPKIARSFNCGSKPKPNQAPPWRLEREPSRLAAAGNETGFENKFHLPAVGCAADGDRPRSG
jgi:hypothetical protein